MRNPYTWKRPFSEDEVVSAYKANFAHAYKVSDFWMPTRVSEKDVGFDLAILTKNSKKRYEIKNVKRSFNTFIQFKLSYLRKLPREIGQEFNVDSFLSFKIHNDRSQQQYKKLLQLKTKSKGLSKVYYGTNAYFTLEEHKAIDTNLSKSNLDKFEMFELDNSFGKHEKVHHHPDSYFFILNPEILRKKKTKTTEILEEITFPNDDLPNSNRGTEAMNYLSEIIYRDFIEKDRKALRSFLNINNQLTDLPNSMSRYFIIRKVLQDNFNIIWHSALLTEENELYRL